MLLSFIGWIIVGVFTGWMASVPLPVQGRIRVKNRLPNALLGALAGGLVVYVIGFQSAALTDFNLFSVVAAFVGAAVLSIRDGEHVGAAFEVERPVKILEEAPAAEKGEESSNGSSLR